MKTTCLSCLIGALAIAPIFVRAESPATRPTTTRAAILPPATQPATSAPATTVVKRGSLPMKFDAAGYLEPVDPVEVRLRFKQYAGDLTITAIAANGAAVQKGDTILEFDRTALQKLLDAAENDLAAAKANLEKSEAEFKLSEASEAFNLKTHQDALKDAENAVEWWEKVDGPQMLQGWELQIKQYQHMVDDRTDELEQLKKMYKTEELTSATADIVVKRAVRGLEQAKIGFEMEKERIEKDKTIYYPASKRGVVDGLTKARQALALHQVAQEHVKSQWKSVLFTTRAAMAAAALKVSELRGDLDKLAFTSPSDGIVWYGQLVGGYWYGGDPKAMRIGEKLAAGANLLTLYSPGKLRAVVDLTEARYFTVSAGTKATITPAAFPGMRIEGACDAPPRTGAVSADRNVTYPLKITSADVDARLIPGMRLNVKLDVPPAEGLLLVPVGAVSNGEVWVRAKGHDSKRAVVTGRSDGKSIEIVSGLSDGEAILTQAKAAN